MMGLALGYRLSKKGYQVHILEAEEQIGGLSTWFDYGDFTWDKYYHVILKSDSHLLGLIDELGLTEKLIWTPTKTGFLWRGKLISMSNYWEFLKFPALNFFQKLRLGFGILYSQYFVKPKNLESIPAKTWLKRVFGKGVFEVIWEPLLESKFGVLKDQVPATIIASTLNRYYSTRDKGGGKEWMGHLKGSGLKPLFEALEKEIVKRGGKVECHAAVKSIDDSDPKSLSVETAKGSYQFDTLYSTLPTAILQRIAPNLHFEAVSSKKPKFLGVIRLALVLKRSLSPYYVTNLIDRGNPYTGIIEVSALTLSEELQGKHLVMIPRYDVPDSEWFMKSDEEVKQSFISSIEKSWPNIEEEIIHSYVHRAPVVQALWIDSPPDTQYPAHTKDGRILSINAELAGRDTLNNNALVGVANHITDEIHEKIKNQIKRH